MTDGIARVSTACPSTEKLDKYVAGRLFELERRLVHEHVEGCGRCSAMVTRPNATTPSGTPVSSSQTELNTRPVERGAAEAIDKGVSVGRYVVMEPVGRGGMGIVYSAYDPKLKREVAVKLLRPDRPGEQHGLALLEEAQALAKPNHPNIVTVYDVGVFNGQVFIAMDFVPGGTLTTWLNKRQRSWREVLDLFLAAGEGLAAVHRVGLVHRDFKRDNVLVDHEGKPHVTDFGLAAEVGPGGAELGGRRVGTPGYRAPEQERRERADALSDQFSFCAALYEALYGELPYGARPDPLAPLGPVRAAVPEKKVPGWLRRVLLKGLSPEREGRFESMEALLKALRDDPGKKLKGRLLALGLVASIGAIAATGGWFFTRAKRECLEKAQTGMAQAWSPARQREIQSAFRAVAGDNSPWVQVAERLGSTVNGWSQVANETCALPQSDPTRERVLECLEGRRAVLQSMSDLFAGADREVTDNAITTILLEVRPAEACRLPVEKQRERVGDTGQAESLRGALARVRVFRSAGKYDEGIREANKIVRLAEEAGDKRVEADARLVLGGMYADLRQTSSEAMLRQSAIDAEAAADDELRARAKIGLVGVYSDQQRFEEAHWARDAAQALIGRMGKPPLLEAALLTQQGRLAARKGEEEEALEYFQKALALLRTVLPDENPQVQNLRIAVGLSLPGEEGVEMIREVLELRLALFGSRHPETALGYFNLGSKWLQLCAELEGEQLQDACSRALKAFESEWEIRKLSPGVDTPRAWRNRLAIAQCLRLLVRSADAWDYQQAGLRLMRDGNAPRADLRRELDLLFEQCRELGKPGDECEAIDRARKTLEGDPTDTR
jgi:eukaryotic-like serine/threonine-protein kinase